MTEPADGVAPVADLRFDGVSVCYDGRPALSEIDLSVPSGSWVAVIGPNGAGKSSLLRAAAGLVDHAGSIAVGGTDLGSADRAGRARLMAYVPQNPAVPDAMTVAEYVLLGRTAHVSWLASESAHDREVGREALGRLDLSDLAQRPLAAVSGGEFQRATLARAIAQAAPVLLLDEPTSALDLGHQVKVLELIDELRRERGLTVVCAMHDLTLAGQFTERLVLLADGRLVADGSADEVLDASLLGLHYGTDVRVLDDPAGGRVVLAARPSPNSRP